MCKYILIIFRPNCYIEYLCTMLPQPFSTPLNFCFGKLDHINGQTRLPYMGTLVNYSHFICFTSNSTFICFNKFNSLFGNCSSINFYLSNGGYFVFFGGEIRQFAPFLIYSSQLKCS